MALVWFKKIWQSEALRIPLCCAAALGSGILLSMGTVSGVSSPLAAALAGICTPLYSFSILLGTLLAYVACGAPEGMTFLIASLVCITCMRMLFREAAKPNLLAVLTAVSGILGGFVLDMLLVSAHGKLPLYVMEALLTGTAAYFLADAADTLHRQKRISLSAGKSFTFSLCYLLSITALCGLDFSLCNPGRIIGIAVTMLFARQMHQQGGTLCGSLTVCGVVFCSVPLGTPLLFLPVTAMLSGFLSKLPDALFIPVFFLLQTFSSAIFDSSHELLKLMTELLLACMLYALCSHMDIRRFTAPEQAEVFERSARTRQERFLYEALRELREETSEVMHRLTVCKPKDTVLQLREQVCTGCCGDCWKTTNARQTVQQFRLLLHGLHGYDNAPDCIRRERLLSTAGELSRQSALEQMQRVHLLQNRAVTLECLQLLEMMASDTAAKREFTCAEAETEALRQILRQCACEEGSCFVYQLRSGRYAAEVYTRQAYFPAASVRELLAQRLGTELFYVQTEQKIVRRFCFYQTPAYSMQYALRSVNAPSYERCGDHADAFTDAAGNQYLVLSDGMGSGSTASLASRIAVRTFRKMVSSGMPAETAIRLVNTMLLTETNTENFATLDILMLHADTGELTMTKSGAAATLFCRNGQMQRISSQSFPVGIVPDAMPSRKKMTAMDGDAIVMLSDGIGEAEYPYIRQLLQQDLPLEDIVEAVFAKASVFQGGAQRDDMTVIVARIKQEKSDNNCQNHTISIPENGNYVLEGSKKL